MEIDSSTSEQSLVFQPITIPETKVLAIASHVVHGYVGNKVVSFVLQSLGCEVSGINTVNYSNHTGYKGWKGTKALPDQIWDLYQGLEDAHLAGFDVVLSGYLPSPEAIEKVGTIVRRVREKSAKVFWAMDPVMGDNGRYYVPKESAPVYRNLLSHCHLILPNQFELGELAEQTVTNLKDVRVAIELLHGKHGVKNVLITSTVPELAKQEIEAGNIPPPSDDNEYMLVVGSTETSNHKARPFALLIPCFPIYFTGTGDMFAALLVAYLRAEAAKRNLLDVPGWVSEDTVQAHELPLAKAAEMAVEGMQKVLRKTWARYQAEKEKVDQDSSLNEKERHVKLMRALELRVVGNIDDVKNVTGTAFKVWNLT